MKRRLPLLGVACSFAFVLLACGSSGTGGAAPASSPAKDGGTDAPPLPDTAPTKITATGPETWTWVPFEEAHCRDGSTTGIGININPDSKNLMIFLDGGGACFNSTTCLLNPSSFDKTTFDSSFGSGGSRASAGVFDRSDPANPMKDWNYVFVPYCTGDVFSGNNQDVTVPGVSGKQQFVGYADMHVFLDRIVPTFADVTQVVLTGISAGGFGVASNYTQVAKAFGKVPVIALDDSGPAMGPPEVASCLLQQTRELWGLDNTILADCGADCSDLTNYETEYAGHIIKAYPGATFGLIDTVDDGVITLFFGFGANNCTSSVPLSQSTYTEGLDAIRTVFKADPNFGSFIFGDDPSTCGCSGSSQHTSLGGSTLDTVTASDGTKLSDWVAHLIAGKVTNVGP